ncbi:MAG: hypothetical protein EPO40_21930 [Myxococcaceae bacterium]|nr:MAG: hypothetical protein EPO40_21930 [Myxococcaceae bacterium]
MAALLDEVAKVAGSTPDAQQHLPSDRRERRETSSPRVREVLSEGELSRGFLAYEGRPLAKPARHPLSATMLARHRREFDRINA